MEEVGVCPISKGELSDDRYIKEDRIYGVYMEVI